MFTSIEIEVQPCISEPKIELKKPKKKRSKWDIFRWPHRILMLSEPRPPAKQKYVVPPPEPFKTFGPVEPGVEFRDSHLSRPFLRKLFEDKRRFEPLPMPPYPKITKNIDKRIKIGWESIYNFYTKQLRAKRLKRLKRLQEKKAAKKPDKKKQQAIEEKRKEHVLSLANPKPVFLPEKIVRKRQALDEIMAVVNELAHPVEHPELPVRDISKVASAALVFEPTENVLKLSKPRMAHRSEILLRPGGVRPGALKAKCTPRVETLAKPSLGRTQAKQQEDDKWDPWEISKNALKYKPTERILELAKPLERD